MTRRCILHIGMHKTGSSSIQGTLFSLRDRDLPWTYLNPGLPNSSEPLLNMFRCHPESYHINIKRGVDRNEIAARREQFFKKYEEQMTSSGKDVILSAEGVSELSQVELGELAKWLGKFVDEVMVVAYIRPPRTFMESGFQQNVKGGGGTFNLKSLYPYYREKFEKFEAVFGQDAVKYWLFDPAGFVNGCVVRDFANRLDLKLSADEVVRVNEGLSRAALSALYAYRKYGEDYGVGQNAMRENRKLIKKLAELTGDKVRFSPDLVRPVIDANRADIEWIEERLGRKFEEDIESRTEFDISNESDLLKCSEASLETIRQWVGVPSSEPANTPQQVAKLVGQLRRALSERSVESDNPIICNRHKEAEEMTLIELFGKVKSAHPEQFERINDKKAVAILRAAFSEIKKEIDGIEDGVVKVPSLGNFRITQVEREVEGTKVIRKRVMFRAAVANSKKED